jgi:hypothetical protein
MTLSHTILEEHAMEIENDDGDDVTAVYISYMCLHLMNCSLMTLSHTILEEHAMDIGNDDGGDVTAVYYIIYVFASYELFINDSITYHFRGTCYGN